MTIKDDIRVNGPLPLAEDMELAIITQRNRLIDPQAGWPVLARAMSTPDLAACVKIGVTKIEKTIRDAIPKGAARGAKKRAVAEVMDDLKAVDALGYKEIQKLGKRAIQDAE